MTDVLDRIGEQLERAESDLWQTASLTSPARTFARPADALGGFAAP